MDKWIAVANISETFLHSYDRVRDLAARQQQISEDQYLGERALLWGGDHKLVITSWPVDVSHLRYIQEVMNYSELANVSPEHPTLRLSQDILRETLLLYRIVEFCKGADRVHLISYSTTTPFIDLAEHLVHLGLPIQIDEACSRSGIWLRDYLDSKGGFREFILPLKDQFTVFRVPEGFWARDWKEAVPIVSSFLAHGRACICKPNRGEGGAGIVIFDPREYAGLANPQDTVRDRLDADDYLQMDSVVVEEYVALDRSIAGGSPSMDWFIPRDQDEPIRLLGIEAQLLSSEGIFEGVEIGEGVLPRDVERAMVNDSRLIAQKMRDWGYVGPLDIDMVLDREGRLWPVESNTRRTGASHALDAATFLFGPEFWKKVTVLTLDHLQLQSAPAHLDDVKKRLKSLMFPMDHSPQGLVLDIAASLNQGKMGYLIFAPSPEQARNLHNAAGKLLEGL